MEDFLTYLKSSKGFVRSQPTESRVVHFTMGNESCDLDSSVASLILGYFLSRQCSQGAVIPVLNVSRENFLLRTENCYVLSEVNVPLDDLVFRNEINFEEVLSKNTVTVSLVDHHILSKADELLEKYVTDIFDHRPVDSSHHWDPNKVKLRIEPVGSCCTLIADEVLKVDGTILSKPLAYLLYQAIVYDTIALKPENHKATQLDVNTAAKLEQTYGFTENRQVLFNRLWQAHNDVSGLTPRQLLYKDLKMVEGVYMPGLPMLVEEYLNMEGSMGAIEEFANEHEVTCLVLVGLNASNDCVRRDLAVYSETLGDKLRKIILEALTSNEEFNFQLEVRETKHDDKMRLLHIHNTKLSRKQMVPVVKRAWATFVKNEK